MQERHRVARLVELSRSVLNIDATGPEEPRTDVKAGMEEG
jgi:hypothetical protein